jgi:hypothetical protein
VRAVRYGGPLSVKSVRWRQHITNGERLRSKAATALRDTESSAPRCGASGSASLT